MTRKLLSLLTIAASACSLPSCLDLKGDGETMLNDYTNCFSYVLDKSTGTGYIDLGSTYEVIGDYNRGSFTVRANNVTLFDGAPALSAEVTDLMQYMPEGYKYPFMQQSEYNISSGQFTIRNLRYAHVGNYWLTYEAGELNSFVTDYTVNVIPRSYHAIADTVMVRRLDTGRDYTDTALDSRVDINFSHPGTEVSLSVGSIRFHSGGKPVELELPDMPVTFDATGWLVEVPEVIPTSPRGEKLTDYRMTTFKATMPLTFEGAKRITFYMPDYPEGPVYVTLKLYSHDMN